MDFQIYVMNEFIILIYKISIESKMIDENDKGKGYDELVDTP